MLSSLKFIHILIILLGSTGTIKEVRAQGAIQFIVNLIKEFFGLQSSTPAAESSKPADSATSAAVDTSKTIANNQPATITVNLCHLVIAFRKCIIFLSNYFKMPSFHVYN